MTTPDDARAPLEFSTVRGRLARALVSRLAVAGSSSTGEVVLDSWPAVHAILERYKASISDEAFLRSSGAPASLASLLGYQARPAVGAVARLAIDGSVEDEVAVRDSKTGQVFVTELDGGEGREWTLAPLRAASSAITLEAGGARLTRDQLAVFTWPAPPGLESSVLEARTTAFGANAPGVTQDTGGAAARVMETTSRADAAGVSLLDVSVAPRFALDGTGVLPENIAVRTASQFARLTPHTPTTTSVPIPSIEPEILAESASPTATIAYLDGVYPTLAAGSYLVVRRGVELRLTSVTSATQASVDLSFTTEVTSAASRIRFVPPLDADWLDTPGELTFHFGLVDAGKLTRPAKATVTRADLAGSGIPIQGTVDPTEDGATGAFLLEGADGRGAHVAGHVEVTAAGQGTFFLDEGEEFPEAIAQPIKLRGGLVRATCGQPVFDEVLGGGDGSTVFQSFTLEQAPLTYLADEDGPDGIRSTLEVRVDGWLWKEQPSFYDAAPDARCYVVRLDDEGAATITFGDGLTGMRLPTGTDNVVATYRFGAGAAKPAPGSLTQLVRPVPGVRRIFDPVGAFGGRDADRPEDIRRNAPASTLTLGRAVSLADYEVIARQSPGVLNAKASYGWDERRQGAAVLVDIISDGGSVARQVASTIRRMTHENAAFTVREAIAEPATLHIELEYEQGAPRAEVSQAVRDALLDPRIGPLSLENVPIGGALYRSRLFDAVLGVEGVKGICVFHINGGPPDLVVAAAGRPSEGRYLRFVDDGAVTVPGGSTVEPPGHGGGEPLISAPFLADHEHADLETDLAALEGRVTALAAEFALESGTPTWVGALDREIDFADGLVVAGGVVLDGSELTAGTPTLRLIGLLTLAGAGTGELTLWDMGAVGSGPSAGVLRATATIPNGSAGGLVVIDRPLTVSGFPGVDTNQIHSSARRYELRLQVLGGLAGDTLKVHSGGVALIG